MRYFLCVMKKISIMEAQHNLSKVLRSIRPQERIAITRNKRVVAELAISSEQRRPDFPDFGGRAKTTWGSSWDGGSSTDSLVNESRGDR